MRSLMPWSGITGLKQDMDRVFDRFFESRWEELPALGDWMPKVDVSETKDSVVVKAETPGMEAKDIQVSLQENVLTITGEKKRKRKRRKRTSGTTAWSAATARSRGACGCRPASRPAR